MSTEYALSDNYSMYYTLHGYNTEYSLYREFKDIEIILFSRPPYK